MSRLYVLVRPGRRPAAVKTMVRWLHALVPAAILLTAPGAQAPDDDDDDAVVISLDADEVASSGPLALADAIARGRVVRPEGGGSPPPADG